MSKPTETTNERVPRDIVRIGTTIGKRRETHSECREASGRGPRGVGKRGEVLGKRRGSVGEACGECWGVHELVSSRNRSVRRHGTGSS